LRIEHGVHCKRNSLEAGRAAQDDKVHLEIAKEEIIYFETDVRYGTLLLCEGLNHSGGLGQEDDQFHLRVEDIGRGVDGEVARAQHRLPDWAALFNGEVLVAQLDWNRPGWRGDVLQAQSGQGVADEGFELGCGACFQQLL